MLQPAFFMLLAGLGPSSRFIRLWRAEAPLKPHMLMSSSSVNNRSFISSMVLMGQQLSSGKQVSSWQMEYFFFVVFADQDVLKRQRHQFAANNWKRNQTKSPRPWPKQHPFHDDQTDVLQRWHHRARRYARRVGHREFAVIVPVSSCLIAKHKTAGMSNRSTIIYNYIK